ncbi:MAG: 2-alkenal reductase, partial [Akkermansia sp.]
ILSVDGYDVDSSGMVELDGEKIQVNELTERCFSGNTLPMTVQRDGKKLDLRVTLKPSPGALILEEEYDKLPRYVVYGGLVFQPLQRNVLSSHKIPIADVALELRHFKEEGGSLEKEDVVIITSVLDDEVNARLSDTSSHRIVNKVNGIPVKGLTHLYQLLYEANDPKSKESPYITIETKGNNRPIVFDKNTINAANQRIASQYKIYKNARLDATRPVDQATPSVSSPLPRKS